MKTFKEYINENPMIDYNVSKDKPDSFNDSPKIYNKRENIGVIGKHKVKRLSLDGFRKSYTLHDSKDNISFKAAGNQNGNKFVVSNLEGTDTAPIKAHEFYHHLIHQQGLHLHSDALQSPGGKKVWERLHKMPGIKMQSLNVETGKYSDIHPNESLDKYYGTYNTRLAAKKI